MQPTLQISLVPPHQQKRLDYLLRTTTLGMSLVEMFGFELKKATLEINKESPYLRKMAAKTLEAQSVCGEALRAIFHKTELSPDYVHDCNDDLIEIVKAYVDMTPAERKRLMDSLPKKD